jgi:hypothetical protein
MLEDVEVIVRNVVRQLGGASYRGANHSVASVEDHIANMAREILDQLVGEVGLVKSVETAAPHSIGQIVCYLEHGVTGRCDIFHSRPIIDCHVHFLGCRVLRVADKRAVSADSEFAPDVAPGQKRVEER